MRTFILITFLCGSVFTSSIKKVAKLSHESSTAAPYHTIDETKKFEEETISSTEINPILLEGLNFDLEPKISASNDVHEKCGESKDFVIQVEEPSDIYKSYPPKAPLKEDNEIPKATIALPQEENQDEKTIYTPAIDHYSDKKIPNPPKLPAFDLLEFVKNQKLSELPSTTPHYEKPQTTETSIWISPTTPKPDTILTDLYPMPQKIPSWTTEDVNESNSKIFNFGPPPVLAPLDYKFLITKFEEGATIKENDSQLPEPALPPSKYPEPAYTIKTPQENYGKQPQEHKNIPEGPKLPPFSWAYLPQSEIVLSTEAPKILTPTYIPSYKPPMPETTIAPEKKLPTVTILPHTTVVPHINYPQPIQPCQEISSHNEYNPNLLPQENYEKPSQEYKNIPSGPKLPPFSWVQFPKPENIPSTEEPKIPSPTYIPPMPEITIAPEKKLPTITILPHTTVVPHINYPQPIQPCMDISSHNEYNPHLLPQENYEKPSQEYKNIPSGPKLRPFSWVQIPKSEINPSTEEPKIPTSTYIPPFTSPTPETTIAPEIKLPTVTILPSIPTVVPHFLPPQPAKPPVEISPHNECNPHHHHHNHHKQNSDPCTLLLLLKKQCKKNKMN